MEGITRDRGAKLNKHRKREFNMKKYLLEIKEATGLKYADYVAYLYESYTDNLLSTYFFVSKDITKNFVYLRDMNDIAISTLPLAKVTVVEYFDSPEEF